MTTIRAGASRAAASFRSLAAALEGGDGAHRRLVDPESLEDEYGRFRVWSGNLGAQGRGHSSLDYRLRDSPLLQSNVLKLLLELEANLDEATAVVTGARLPYEQQADAGDFSDSEDSASGDSTDGEGESDEERPRFELQQRMSEVVDIVNNLYKLSIRIRSPTLRTRSLRAAAFRPRDPDTGVDLFAQYAEYDKRHVEDALAQLRSGFPARQDGLGFLVERLSKAITKRRQQFKYWKKHRDKLAVASAQEDADLHPAGAHGVREKKPENASVEEPAQLPAVVRIVRSPESEMNPRTLLSGTEATAHHRTLDDAVDSQSVTSVATTARDLGGHGVDLPPPPHTADGEKDFECPYCFVICPARYCRERPWKTHLLQDLQPYLCTYPDCPDADQLFSSRREWLEHESSAHRKLWRCPSHADAVYSSEGGIKTHLETVHGKDLSEQQVTQAIRVAETSAVDTRRSCPICNADAATIGNFQNHIANHLEKFASFAIPKHPGLDGDRSGASNNASHGRNSSSGKSDNASQRWSADTVSEQDEDQWIPASNDDLASSSIADAEELINRLAILLENIERPTQPGFVSGEDWIKVRPSLRSSFIHPQAPEVFAGLDKLFHDVRNSHADFEEIKSQIRALLTLHAQLSQLDTNKDRPELSTDAIRTLPDARGEKMDIFLASSEAGGLKVASSGNDTVRPAEEGASSEESNEIEVHSDGWLQQAPKDSSDAQSKAKKELKRVWIIKITNLPTGLEEREEFAAAFSNLGWYGFHLDPQDLSRAYAKFKALDHAKRALDSFDRSKFPGIKLDLELEDVKAPRVAPAQSSLTGADIEKLLQNLDRILGKPEYRDMITWADGGQTFFILDEERFSRELLPSFGLDDFEVFKLRLISCGFRQTVDRDAISRGERRTSNWYHKYFCRDTPPALRGRIQLAAHLTKRIYKAQSSLSKQIENVCSAMDSSFFERSRSRFVLKTVSDLPSVAELYLDGSLQDPEGSKSPHLHPPNDEFNRKVSMLQHDLTMLNVDAIVNGTTPGLNAGASDSISWWVHEAAGPELLQECYSMGGCEMGKAVITDAYNLPCRKIIHTVRPHYVQAVNAVGHWNLLANCYRSCLKLAVENGLESIAFPCLSAGGFGFPAREAAEIALGTTREFLESGGGAGLKKILFCVYKDADAMVYRMLLPIFFPPSTPRAQLGLYEARNVREESPQSLGGDLVASPIQEPADMFDMEINAAESSEPMLRKSSWMSASVESLNRLAGGPSLWACCKCRARPMETPNCLVCFHPLCSSCEGENAVEAAPNLWLVYLHPSASMLESSQESGLTSLDRRDLMVQEDQIKASIRSRPNSPTKHHRPSYVKIHRKHLSLDTLFYYDLPFEFDNNDQDYIVILRELSDEQTQVLFRHSRWHRRHLPSLIRTRTHPNPYSPLLTIRIGSDTTFSRQDHPPGAPIFMPPPFVTADHCNFYIEGARTWMVEINRDSGSTFLNGRKLARLPASDDHGQLPPHDNRGYFVSSGDVLGLGENDDGKPVYLFRVECDSVWAAEDAVWEEAEARASRYGFPTIGLDEGGDEDNGASDSDGNDSDDSDAAEADLDIRSGFKIIDAVKETGGTASDPPALGRRSSSGIGGGVAQAVPGVGERWTKIDRRLVNPRALEEAGERFENRVRYMVVFRELSVAQMQRLATRTRESRELKTATEYTKKERARKMRSLRRERATGRGRKREKQEAVEAGPA